MRLSCRSRQNRTNTRGGSWVAAEYRGELLQMRIEAGRDVEVVVVDQRKGRLMHVQGVGTARRSA